MLPFVEILRAISVVLLLNLSVQVWLHGRALSRILAAFLLSVAGHLIVGSAIDLYAPLEYAMEWLALLPLPLFYLLCRTLFDDSFEPGPRHLILPVTAASLALLIVLFREALLALVRGNVPLEFPVSIQPQAPLLLFLIPAAVHIAKRQSEDLIPWRYRLRPLLLGFLGSIVFAVATVEILYRPDPVPEFLDALKILVISLIAFFAPFWLLQVRPDLMPASGARDLRSVDNPGRGSDKDLLGALSQAIGEKIHHSEGLTIGQLARSLNCQEYKLRRLINGELGFSNFNQFLNTHRINDAREMLLDPALSEQPILRIAYDLGYQTLAPFNLAFKQLVGQTPSVYRKSGLDPHKSE